jgi:hypothetical protein
MKFSSGFLSVSVICLTVLIIFFTSIYINSSVTKKRNLELEERVKEYQTLNSDKSHNKFRDIFFPCVDFLVENNIEYNRAKQLCEKINQF